MYSKIKDSYYVGCTFDIKQRLIRHNQNNSGFTGKVSDWIVMYTEEFISKEIALAREKQIKSWKSRKAIENLINGR